MLPGPLISVATELAARLRPAALLLLSGFRTDDLGALHEVFEPYFEMPTDGEGATLERDGWLMLACRRREGAALDSAALADSAVE